MDLNDLITYLLDQYTKPGEDGEPSEWQKQVVNELNPGGQLLARTVLLDFTHFAREHLKKNQVTQFTYHEDLPALVLTNHEIVTWPSDIDPAAMQDDTVIQINQAGPRRSIEQSAMQLNNASRQASTQNMQEIVDRMRPSA